MWTPSSSNKALRPSVLAAASCCALAAVSALRAADEKPVLCVYDLASAFDKNELGKKTAEILRGHARRGGEYSLMVDIDREDLAEAHPLTPKLDTPEKDIAAHAREFYKAGRVLYGEIEKGKGDALKVTVRVLDVPPEGVPVEKLKKTYEAENKYTLPVVADAILADLAGRPSPLRRDKALPITYKIVTDNLVPNPSFEEADKDDANRPARWTDASVKKQSAWIARDGDAKPGDAKCLELHPDKEMAESYGLIWYSDYIPVEKAAAYILSMDLKAKGCSVIIWTKGYTDMNGEKRNTYKYQKRFYPEKGGAWEHWQTEPFVPRHPVANVQWVRVMLYAYCAEGKAWFDHIDLRKVEITSGETRKADFETKENATHGWQEKAMIEGDSKDLPKDPEEKK
ncbi:MAG: hypothetical protein HY291_16705 [Planctomycetes bacterium]|nr:hypothetical protein [Planctomycetota bacterium]